MSITSDDAATQQIMSALRRVIEPTANQNVLDLGLVRGVRLADGAAWIDYELPEQLVGSPVEQELRLRTQAALHMTPGVERVEVRVAARPAPRATNTLPGVQNVIAVGAGKGGVGKSTLSVLLALGLKRRGLRVGVLDADVYGPSIPKLTGTETAQPVGDAQGRIVPPESDDGLKVMSMGYLVPANEVVVWRGPMAQKYVKEFLDRGAWGELDHLIVDLPPGTGDIPLTLSQSIPLTGAVVVCTPQDVALLDALKAYRMYRKLNVPVLGFVENMSYYLNPASNQREFIFGNGGVERAARANSVPYLGGLPLHQLIRESGDAGTPTDCFQHAPPHVREALEQIVENLLREVAARRSTATPLPQLRIR